MMKNHFFEHFLCLLIACLFLNAEWSYSQEQDPEPSQQVSEYESYIAAFQEIPDPQIWSFMRYGNNDALLYTGTPKFEIPFYVYKDNDFEIPISLEYASNGHMPEIPASSMGLGWFLNAGGYITRQINDSPDEANVTIKGGGEGGNIFIMMSPGQTDYNRLLHGYYTLHTRLKNCPQHNNSVDVLDYAGLYRFLYSAYTAYYFGQHNNVFGCFMDQTETTPDHFSFKFLNHKGSFVMSLDTVYVHSSNHPAGEYCIDLSRFSELYRADSVVTDTIRIRTGDGYWYTFGSPDHYPVETFGYWGKLNVGRKSWHISEIEAPNGRKVEFEYYPPEGSDTDHANMGPGGDGGTYLTREYTDQIKKIIIDGLSINFEYKDRKPEYKKNDYYSALERLRLLNKITVMNEKTGYIIKKCELFYSYSPPNEPDTEKGANIPFLSKVSVSGEGDYSMIYYNQNQRFPQVKEYALDHWRFYNKKDDNNYDNTVLFNSDFPSNQYCEEYVSPESRRQPDFEGSVFGMLKTVTYPTGGKTEYYYEPHKYSKRVVKDLRSNFRAYLKDTTAYAGGVRIHKMVDYKNERDSTVREFIYRCVEIDGTLGQDSGTLLYFPRYSAKAFPYSNSSTYERILDKINIFDGDNHIEYTEVVEKFDDGSFNAYTYTDYNSTYVYRPIEAKGVGDFSPPESYYIDGVGDVTRSQWTNLLTSNYDNHFNRGLLKRERAFGKDGSLLLSKEYNYAPHNYDESGRSLTSFSIRESLDYLLYKAHCQLGDYRKPKEIIVTEYFENGIGIRTRSVDSYNRLGQTEVNNFTGPFYSSTHKTDYIGNKTYQELNEIEKFMYDKGIFNKQLGYTKLVGENVVEAEKYEYRKSTQQLSGNQSEIVVLDKLLKAGIDTGNSISYDDHIHLDAYDYNGNILQIRDSSGAITSFIWGYGGRHIVAIIKNASIETVKSQTKLSLALPLSGGLSEGEEIALRNIPEALVTTCKHIPYVGISEITDPARRKSFYEYNSNGKLWRIKDDTGAITHEYEYSVD